MFTSDEWAQRYPVPPKGIKHLMIGAIEAPAKMTALKQDHSIETVVIHLQNVRPFS